MPIATLPNATSYSLSGEDAAIFQINALTGEVSYQSWFTPSYAEVWDLDRDHIYEISVVGTNSAGVEVGHVGFELVVSETDAVWRDAETGDAVAPETPVVDPVTPEIDPTAPQDTVVYTLSGDDAAIFQIDAATGEVSYQSWFTPSYAEVWDLDRDHIYEITVTGSDAAGAEVSRTDLELVVTEEDAVWQTADGAAPADPVDPVVPTDPAQPTTGAVSFALAGEDASIFQVDATTGEVSYQSWFTPSYDQVWDLDRDHIYEIEVIGSDGAGVEVSRTGLELVVSETDAVWRTVAGSDPIDPVAPPDPAEPVESAEPVIVIERLDGDASETVYGIRDDTSSRGVDLAGAVIVATYANGTVETLTWEAYDPYTLGGAAGTDITLAYGWDAHELTVSKQLATLEINLAPASSVFDTTATLDDDPLGGSTIGSSFGYAFEFLDDTAGLSGEVTVTYSDIVNLAGTAAQGDLYTTMLIDFSALTGGGLLGDVTWNSDIDTLRNQGDLVPTVTSGAGTGTDILTGSTDADTFVFADGSGDMQIAGFDISGGDTLDIQAFSFADYDAVLATAVDVGVGALIQLDTDDSLTLLGISLSDLDARHSWLLTA